MQTRADRRGSRRPRNEGPLRTTGAGLVVFGGFNRDDPRLIFLLGQREGDQLRAVHRAARDDDELPALAHEGHWHRSTANEMDRLMGAFKEIFTGATAVGSKSGARR